MEQGTHAELMAANRDYATLVALQQAEGGMQGPAEEEQSGSEGGSEGGSQEVSQWDMAFPPFPSLCSGAEGVGSVVRGCSAAAMHLGYIASGGSTSGTHFCCCRA